MLDSCCWAATCNETVPLNKEKDGDLGKVTHGIAPEFVHNVPNGMFVFFQQQTQLSVFLKESVIFDDRRCIDTFLLRLESFYYTDTLEHRKLHRTGGRMQRTQHTPFEISVLNLRRLNPVAENCPASAYR